MRYSWLLIAISLIVGLLLPTDAGLLLPMQAALIATFLLAFVLALLSRYRIAYLAICFAVLIIGQLSNISFLLEHPDNHLESLIERGQIDPDGTLELIGEIDGHIELSPDRMRLLIKLQKINNLAATGKIYLNVKLPDRWLGEPLPFRWGDSIRFIAGLEQPSSATNPGTFDYRAWLARKGIYRLSFLKSPLAVKILQPGSSFDPRRLLSSYKAHLRQSLYRFFGNEIAAVSDKGALLNALVLGDRGFIDEEVIKSFRFSGLIHIIAISGFHIGIIALFSVGLLRAIKLTPRFAYLISTVIIFAYWLLAGARPSTTRAAIVAALFLISKAFDRQSNSLNILAFAAFAFLIFVPASLTDAGFILTFVAVLSIIILHKVIRGVLNSDFFIAKSLSVSIAATLGTLPIISSVFHMVNLHAAVTGIIVMPLASIVIAFGLFLMIFLQYIPLLNLFLVKIMDLLLWLLLETIEFLKALLPFTIRGPAPPGWLILLFYLVLIGWAVAESYRQKEDLGRVGRRTVYLVIPLLLVLAMIVINPTVQLEIGELRIHALDVGAGSATLVQSAAGTTVLIDGGGIPRSDFDIGENIVSPYLWHVGIRKLDALIITHAHADHLKGMFAVLRNFKVGKIYFAAYSSGVSLGRRFAELAKSKSVPFEYLHLDQTIEIKDLTLTTFGPPEEPFVGRRNLNNKSLIAKLSDDQTDILITGDAEIEALQLAYEKYGALLKADILLVPHHGSDDALHINFLKAVDPEIALISAGDNPQYDASRKVVFEAMRLLEINIWRTKRDGRILVSYDSEGELKIETALSGQQ
jgi:competence protein ComEC